jgi:hypothetical protein
MNIYEKNPFKIHIYDPLNKSVIRTYVIIGDVPQKVYSAINKKDSTVLKSFYGPNYDKKLHIKSKKRGASELYSAYDMLNTLPRSDYDITEFSDNMVLKPYNMDNDIIEGGKISQQTEYAGGDDYEDIEITEDDLILTEKKPTISALEHVNTHVDIKEGIEYVRKLQVYPIDTYSELRSKIYIVTGIPIYRQHIFYGDGITTYRIYANGMWDTDIRKLNTYEQKIINIPIDKDLSDLSDIIKVESYDVFHILNGIPEIYVTDLQLFTGKLTNQIADILKDKYQTDMLYYGFIIKYWPALSYEVFVDYINNENMLYHKYPDLAISKKSLTKLYEKESELMNEMYSENANIESILSNNTTTAITKLIVGVLDSNVEINIRNLFDSLHVSKCMPEIHAYVMPYSKTNEKTQYLLKKYLTRTDVNVPFPGVGETKFNSGIVIAISMKKSDQDAIIKKIEETSLTDIARLYKEYNIIKSTAIMEQEQSKYLFISIQQDGKYFIKTIWNEEDEYTFDRLIEIMKKFTDPLIKYINSLGKYVFNQGGSLNLITDKNVVYMGLNANIFWKQAMSDTNYQIIRRETTNFIESNIMLPYGYQQQNTIEVIFRKGIYEYDPHKIERILMAAAIDTTPNYYLYLTNSTIKNKWDQLYSGRSLLIKHRTADVQFLVHDITYNEFVTYRKLIGKFINNVIANIPKTLITNSQKAPRQVKKLKKLRETDPELFNLKKYGEGKVYSILCQNPMQPTIFTDSEYKMLSNEQKLKLIKFWNFTLNKPAYYGCPSKYPYLSFRVGIHPKGYCVPCCKKGELLDDSKRANVENICLSEFKYTPKNEYPTVSKHIMMYGKQLDNGRLMKLPDILLSVMEFLYKDIPKEDIYTIYGVHQNFPSVNNVGVLYIMSLLLEESIGDILATFSSQIKTHFSELLNGQLTEYFDDGNDLYKTMDRIFVKGGHMLFKSHRFKMWNELFIELAESINLYTFILKDYNDKFSLEVSNRLQNNIIEKININAKYMIIVNIKKEYYPIIVIHENFFKVGDIIKRTFKHNDNLIEYLIKITHDSITQKEKIDMNTPINLHIIKEYVKYGKMRILKKYINMHGYCYGVLITMNKKVIYMPISHSIHTKDDNIPITYDIFKSKILQSGSSALLGFIEGYNKYIRGKYYSKLEPIEYVKYNEKIIGMNIRSGGEILFAYVNGTTDKNLHVKEILYDPTDVNKAIMSRLPPTKDKSDKLLPEALYNNYKYNLFVLEFMDYLGSDRNNNMRKDIDKIIKKMNINNRESTYNELDKLLVEYPDDLLLIKHKIIESLNVHGYVKDTITKNIVEYVDNSIFEFDRTTIKRLRSMKNRKSLTEEVYKIAKHIITERKPKISYMPNVLLPCSTDDNDYCHGDKLMITQVDSMISLLVDDLLNPIKEKYITSNLFIDDIIDYFKFDTHEFESVLIIKRQMY